MIGAATSVLGAVGGFMGNAAPNPGPMGGFGGSADLSAGAGTFGNYGAVSDYVSNFGGWNSNIDYNVDFTPILMAHHSSEVKLWKFQKFNTDRKLHQLTLLR